MLILRNHTLIFRLRNTTGEALLLQLGDASEGDGACQAVRFAT